MTTSATTLPHTALPLSGALELANGPLLQAAARGDRDAWEVLVDRYTGLLRRVVRRYRLDTEEAADVMQTVWLRLAEHLGQLRDPECLPHWLSTVARHQCLRQLSAQGRMDRDAEPDRADPTPGPEQVVVERDEQARVRLALSRLPARDRQLLWLLSQHDKPNYRNVAAVLHKPVGSIGPSRARALARLRVELEREPVAAATRRPSIATAPVRAARSAGPRLVPDRQAA
jgi:RNA polymerase sigma factor (sigma-70 family)